MAGLAEQIIEETVDVGARQATMEGARGTKSVLVFGRAVPVQLYSTVTGAKKVADFETAGPNGGKLRRQDKAVAAEEPPENAGPTPIVEDAPEPEPEAPEPEDTDSREQAFADAEERAMAGMRSEPGEYRSVLVEEGTGIEVEAADVRRGVRLADGTFVDCTERLAAIEEHTRIERMEVIGTVDATRLPTARVKASHYVTANGEDAPETLRLLFEAIRATRRMAVVKWTQKTRQKEGVIVARPSMGGALVLLELAWAEDFRAPGPRQLAHMQAEVTRSEVDAARDLMNALADSPELLNELRDDAIELREELKRAALDGKVDSVVTPPSVASANRSLVDALAASVEQAHAARARA